MNNINPNQNYTNQDHINQNSSVEVSITNKKTGKKTVFITSELASDLFRVTRSAPSSHSKINIDLSKNNNNNNNNNNDENPPAGV